MSEAGDTAKSGVAVGVVKCSGWRLKIEDDQKKLGRWAECAVRSNC
jgi:hypothetical protein